MLDRPQEVDGVVMFWICLWTVLAGVLPLLVIMLVVDLPTYVEKAEAFIRRRRTGGGQQTHVEPVERLAADLHRLSIHLDWIENSDEMHRAARLRAAALAYDDVLLSACRTLEVEVVPDGGTPLHPVERLQTEAALAQRGLVW